MRNKVLSAFTIFITALLFMMVGSLTASDVPENITLDSKVYKKHTKGLVDFSHKKHAEYEGITCQDCHHVYKDCKNTWKEGDAVQKCEACHAETGKPEKGMEKADKIKKFHKEALHANCKGCHKKMIDKKSDLYKEVKKCTGCHPKK